MKKKGRGFKAAVGVIVIVLAAAAGTAVFFHSEIRTICAIKQIHEDRDIYQMTYYGDYKLDEYLATGAKNTEELIDFLGDELAHGLLKSSVKDVPRACSCFFATTPEGDLIFARDLDQNVENVPMILHTVGSKNKEALAVCNMYGCGWTNQTDKLSFEKRLLALGSPYVSLDGMNKEGLAIAELTATGSIPGYDPDKTSLYDFTIIRAVLDKAATVDEAVALMKEHNAAFLAMYPSHYMIADAQGNAAIVEYVKGGISVLPMEGSYQICSNFILTDNPGHEGFGSERYAAYEKVLSKTQGIISVDDALKLLEANTITGCEQWSVVYNLTQRKMYVSVYPEYETVYEYSF